MALSILICSQDGKKPVLVNMQMKGELKSKKLKKKLLIKGISEFGSL